MQYSIHRFRSLFALLVYKVMRRFNQIDLDFIRLRAKFYEELWQKTAAAVDAQFYNLDYGYFSLQKGALTAYFQGPDVMLDTAVTLNLAGNKPLSHKILAQITDYAPPNFIEFDLKRLDIAYAFKQKTPRLLVVKPAGDTGAGKGVSTQLATKNQIKRAAIHASIFGKKLLAEEQVAGDSYRLLFLNGDLIHAIRRDPPILTGDGVNTIKELIAQENQRRLNTTYDSLNPLDIDMDLGITLDNQGLSLNSVLKNGQIIHPKKVVNQNTARENHEIPITAIHPSIVALGIQLVKVLNIELAGIDLITPDISKPLKEVGGVVNEVNTTPGLHHHYLISAPGRSTVAEQITTYLFAKLAYLQKFNLANKDNQQNA